MTDEQVQRIVDALSNPFEPWITVGVALLSLVGGYFIAIYTQRSADRRREKADKIAARKKAIRRANAVLFDLSWCSSRDFQDHVVDAHRQATEIAGELNEHDFHGIITAWWWRQVSLIIDGRRTEIRDNLPTSDEWGILATSARVRFAAWDQGLSPVDHFVIEKDRPWAAAFNEHVEEMRGNDQ